MDDEYFDVYYEDNVRDIVRMIADQAQTRIVEAETRLHLVAKANGSVFATNFSHLKQRYKEIENKKYYHLIMIILMTYIAEIDRSKAIKLAVERDGMTYYSIIESVNRLINTWKDKLKADPEFAQDKGIAMKDIVDLWDHTEVTTEKDKLTGRANLKTQVGIVTTAMRLLEDEKLIYIADTENISKVFPRPELFERVEAIYHHQERYQEMKEFIEQEEKRNA